MPRVASTRRMPVSQQARLSAFRLAELRQRLKPSRLHWFPTLRSTNDHAAVLRKRKRLFAPAVVLTGRQTAGRGRGQNTWWSRAGSLTVTFVIPTDERIEPHQLPLIAGLAVRNAAAELSGTDAIQLKWPNDLQFEGRKLAGLLCERVLNADLVGIGLNANLNPDDAPKNLGRAIASLAQIRGHSLDITGVLATLASHLQMTLKRAAGSSFTAILREYDTHHALIGKRVSVTHAPGETSTSGRCEGLDSIGRLLLRERGKLHHVISGQVQLREIAR
jgi:BirA family biotin operon repressor/biotin-[acetyl-CoA-carboxylase] ligase